MRHPPIAMYPRTAALTAIVDRVLSRPIETLDMAGIHRSRAALYPEYRAGARRPHRHAPLHRRDDLGGRPRRRAAR